MKRFFLLVMTVLLTSLNSFAAGPWQEVVNDVVFADAPTFREFFVRSNKEEFQQIRFQVMSSGARIQRFEVVATNGISYPVWRLEGQYGFGMTNEDIFRPAKIRSARMFVQTLQPGEPVRFRILMR